MANKLFKFLLLPVVQARVILRGLAGYYPCQLFCFFKIFDKRTEIADVTDAEDIIR